MTAKVFVDHLQIRDFRNLAAADVVPSAELNVLAGDNGHGKTSVLEALYAVATSRSFRSDKLAEVIADGTDVAVVRAHVVDDGVGREQRLAVERSRRSIALDGKRPERLSTYATRTPVVVFHPGDLALVAGAAAGRRTLLDRLALFFDPASADHRQRYERALRERQKTLELRGTRAADLDVFEALMVRHGVVFARARASAAAQLAERLATAFESMAPRGLDLRVRHDAGGTDDPEVFAEELAARRERDLRRRTATFGPQRDDLELTLAHRSARRHASQGQQRLLTLALKAAELACVRDARGAYPVLLLDDFSSELDPTRTGAVYDFLRGGQSQVFVTTTRPDLFPTPRGTPGRRDFVLDQGRVLVAS